MVQKIKKRSFYFLICFFPFLGMIVINELVRLTIEEEGYKKQGITAINSAKKNKKKCTWICHNDTSFCKENHVKWAQPYFEQIDPIYFGIIHSLQSTGNYQLANILFLVILIPLLMYYLLVQSIRMQFEIRKIKRERQ